MMGIDTLKVGFVLLLERSTCANLYQSPGTPFVLDFISPMLSWGRLPHLLFAVVDLRNRRM